MLSLKPSSRHKIFLNLYFLHLYLAMLHKKIVKIESVLKKLFKFLWMSFFEHLVHFLLYQKEFTQVHKILYLFIS